ncbi:hypothetical protein [Providencia phage Kokobel2]|nr:hypothetical protein [Providencia phage Kokobel2]
MLSKPRRECPNADFTKGHKQPALLFKHKIIANTIFAVM